MVATTLHSELVSQLRAAVCSMQELVRGTSPESISGDEALTVVGLFGEAERVAASGIALFSPVVDKSGSYAKAGHGSAADWLGKVSGTSSGAAKDRLTAARRAASEPTIIEALHDGKLSSSQLKVVSDTAAAAPGSADTLLDLTDQGASHQELSDAATRLRANARSMETERARRDRVHQMRHFRVRQCPEGGVRGEFSCDEVAWARVFPALEADAKARWKEAGMAEPLDAYRCDAFLAQLGGTGEGNRTARPHTLLIVDAAALQRGTTEEGEICEIEGVGPVSVEAATELIGAGSLQFIVKDGADIRTVTSATRNIPQRVGAALIVRDRTCASGCGKRFGLQADHRLVDYQFDGPTEFENLARLCPSCHDLKTYGGFRLEGRPGAWKWVAPAYPKSAFYIARARQLAAAKAKAMAESKRNGPMQR